MKNQPEIGVVIIGINVEKYIKDCINSVLASNYDNSLLKIVYVDGGSKDKSVEIAKSFKKVHAIELNDKHPTPGKGRNHGWKHLVTPYVQFLDADTILNRNWFKKALSHFDENISAVCGNRSEIFPEKNIYHVFTDLEWDYEKGFCRYFGGDVLLKREVLEETGGFDDDLVAGEDPELSYRIRMNGWKILRIDEDMTLHDINMKTIGSYFKRSYRSGYAYAEIGTRFMFREDKMWLKELLRISLRSLIPLLLITLGIAAGNILSGALAASLVLFRPFLGIKTFNGKSLKNSYRNLYMFHSSMVIFPQFTGILRYLFGVITGKPLRNNA
ncbi:MAG: glycosyltransferase [Desulfobacterales bacterium]|nr:glycosyltransferase [Desulfobacterales bacterium]MCP4163548.1 glycosyltransferase [Deltaproteobacteria bacterium]